MYSPTRRGFLKTTMIGAGVAAASACESNRSAPARPVGPEQTVRTVCTLCPAGCGLGVRVVGGRAVQVKGLEGHPVNDGGLCPRAAAEIQNLYHPDRLFHPIARSGERGGGQWRQLTGDEGLERLCASLRARHVVIGLGAVSMAERELIERLAARLGATLVRVGAPIGAAPEDAFAAMLGGRNYSHDLARADYVLGINWDWLQSHPSPAEAQRSYGELRRGRHARGSLVQAEPRLSVTGSKADRWIPLPSDGGAAFALGIAHAILARGAEAGSARACPDYAAYRALALDARYAPEKVAAALAIDPRALHEIAAELTTRAPAVALSSRGPLAEQMAVLALDLLIGSVGHPGGVVRSDAPAFPDPPAGLEEDSVFPAAKLGATVILYRANPLHQTPPAAGWALGLSRASLVASLGWFVDESAAAADLVIPIATPLESRGLSWGATAGGRLFVAAGPAAVAREGNVLEGGEALLSLATRAGAALPWPDLSHYLAERAESLSAGKLLKAGGFQSLPASAPADDSTHYQFGAARLRALLDARTGASRGDGYALYVHPRLAFPEALGAELPFLHGQTGAEGRELWRTVVEIHPGAAARAGLREGDAVELVSAAGALSVTVHVREGIRPDTLAVGWGLGRRAPGQLGSGPGANPISIVEHAGDWSDTRVRIRRSS